MRNTGGLGVLKSSSVVLLALLGLISSGQAQEPPVPNGTIISGGFETRYGTQWFNGRLVSALGDLPVAIGLGGTVNDRAVRLDAGIAAQLGEQSIVSLVFRGSNERADQALGVVTDERINTYAFSGRLEHTLSGAPAITIFGLADAWHSPGGIRLQTGLLSTTSFGGADGFRLAPGFELNLDGGLSITGSAGWENGSWNGVSGLFAEIETVMPLADFALSAKAWTSPNFGNGAKAAIGYEFDTGLQVSLFAGYEKASAEHAFAGIRFSMPLGGEPGGGSSPLADTLGAHMDHVAETMPGVPFTARSGVTVASTAPPPPPVIFEDVYGTVCAVQEATPGCTFRLSDGSRLKVSDDPDFNRFGGGSNDLWYVTFDGAGNAQVFNNLGQFQYFATAGDFPGHIGGSTIGVGTTGFYWEDVNFGTYWLGRNQVLYSANGGAGNYEQAIN